MDTDAQFDSMNSGESQPNKKRRKSGHKSEETRQRQVAINSMISFLI